MYGEVNLIERALALAATGKYRTATQVRAALQAEGYPRALTGPLFDGASFLKTIRKILKSTPQKSSESDLSAQDTVIG